MYTMCWVNEYGPRFSTHDTREDVRDAIMEGIEHMDWEDIEFLTHANDQHQDGLPHNGIAADILFVWVLGEQKSLSLCNGDWDIYVTKDSEAK